MSYEMRRRVVALESSTSPDQELTILIQFVDPADPEAEPNLASLGDCGPKAAQIRRLDDEALADFEARAKAEAARQFPSMIVGTVSLSNTGRSMER